MRYSIGDLLRQIGRLVRPSELQRLDSEQVEQLARDVGVTANDLRRLSELGPDAANLLYDRLASEGVDARQLEKRHPRVMKDMQLTCSCCDDKERCARDMANAASFDDWKSYCPNSTTIDDLR